MKAAMKAYATVSGMDTTERERLLMAELPQVRYIARRIHDRLPPHVPFDDLLQAGVLGLIDAFHKYDPDKKVQFKSYARHRIRGAILDSLRELDWSPRRLRRQARQIEQASTKLAAELGRAPSESELASELDMELRELQQLLGDLRGLDLGALVTHSDAQDPEEDLCHYVPDAPQEGPFFLCLRSEMKRFLARVISELPPRERQVLNLYYHEELTLKEVGAVLGLHESRVSQIHSGVLVRLRARLRQLMEERPLAWQPGRQAAAAVAQAAWRRY